jgi:hypothetical protein
VEQYLPYFKQQLITIHCQLICLSRLCLLKVHTEIIFLTVPSSLVQWLACCHIFQVLFTESLHGVQLLAPPPFSSASCLFAYLLICVSQAGLEPASSGSTAALLFSQCNVVWRSFVKAGGLGCWSFASSWCFFLPSVAPASQHNF